MIKTHKRSGSDVDFMYPKHGTRNILCRIQGVVDKKGVGPNGPYLTVQSLDGKIRSFSTKKIVEM